MLYCLRHKIPSRGLGPTNKLSESFYTFPERIVPCNWVPAEVRLPEKCSLPPVCRRSTDLNANSTMQVIPSRGSAARSLLTSLQTTLENRWNMENGGVTWQRYHENDLYKYCKCWYTYCVQLWSTSSKLNRRYCGKSTFEGPKIWKIETKRPRRRSRDTVTIEAMCTNAPNGETHCVSNFEAVPVNTSEDIAESSPWKLPKYRKWWIPPLELQEKAWGG